MIRSSRIEAAPLPVQWPDLLSEATLLVLAGAGSFARGQRYHAQDRCRLDVEAGGQSRWRVQGTDNYRVSLALTEAGLEGHCTCPYAEEEEQFCKHLVAAALSWRVRLGGARPGATAADAPSPASPAARKRQELRVFLQTRNAAELSERLFAWAEQDRELLAHLRSWQAQVHAQESPDGWKEAVTELLRSTRDFYDWTGSRDYARRGQQVLPLLQALLECDPLAAQQACVTALRRIYKVGAQADDSGGPIGDLMVAVHDLLLDALAAAPPTGAAAQTWLRTWFDLLAADPWELQADGAMVEVAGPEVAALYSARVAREWAEWLRGRPKAPGGGAASDRPFDSTRWRLRRRYLEDLRRRVDHDVLLDAIRSELEGASEYLELAALLDRMGRQRESLQQLEAADRKFRGHHQVETELLKAYARDGCHEEVLALRRRQLERYPDVAHYQAAMEAARAAGRDVEAWRTELYSWAEQDELRLPEYHRPRASPAAPVRNVTIRVRWLLHDGEADAALALVQEHGMLVAEDALLALGHALAQTQPVASLDIMRRVVRSAMARAQSPYRDQLALIRKWLAGLTPVTAREQLLWLRVEYRAKRNSIAGLADLQ